MKKLGLALGSGSARGWAHIGVIQVLQEADIHIDIVCGSSMGALVGGALADNFMNDLEKMARELTWSNIFSLMDLLFPRFGFIGGKKITKHFRDNFSNAKIEELAMPFAAVATDLITGREVWLQQGSLMDAVRASISMPGLFTPFKYGEQWLVDGGLVNPVPITLCRSMGADIVVAVNLNSDIIGSPCYIVSSKSQNTADLTDDKSKGKFTQFISHHLTSIWKKKEEKRLKDKHSIFDVITASLNIMQDRMTKQRLAGDPPDLLVSPRLSHIGLLEFNRAAEAIEEGRQCMFFMVPMLKAMIKD